MTESASNEGSIWELFDSLIDDKLQKLILRLIVDGRTSDEILEKILSVDLT